jgi:phosphatidylserine decarboxylase
VSRLIARLFILLQHVLPKHLLTAIVFRLAAIRATPVRRFLILQFAKLYGVDTGEAELPVPDGYASFNEFFTRKLAAGLRPIDATTGAIVSPADGTVSAAGQLDKGTVLQAKGLSYSLADLLMTDTADADGFRGGDFMTVYLAPYNYHRVHCPLDGELVAARYVPGSLYSVNAGTVSLLPGLFVRNERLILHFDCAHGPLIVVFVGALHVGSITTPWTGQIRPRRKGVVQDLAIRDGQHSRQIRKGELLGWFNMGSTVIVLTPPGAFRFAPELVTGRTVRMGQAIGLKRQVYQ